MNDCDGIINIGVMRGIISLWMIGMELLTLDGDRNYIHMNDWDVITNIGVMTGIISLWMIATELMTLGVKTGITSLWMIGMVLLTLGYDRNHIFKNDGGGITNIGVMTGCFCPRILLFE